MKLSLTKRFSTLFKKGYTFKKVEEELKIKYTSGIIPFYIENGEKYYGLIFNSNSKHAKEYLGIIKDHDKDGDLTPLDTALRKCKEDIGVTKSMFKKIDHLFIGNIKQITKTYPFYTFSGMLYKKPKIKLLNENDHVLWLPYERALAKIRPTQRIVFQKLSKT